MQDHKLTIASSGIDLTHDGRLSATSIARRVLQGVGGGACVLLAAAMPWAEFSASGITLGTLAVPMPILIAISLTIVIGLAFFASSVWGLVKRLPAHTRFGVLAIAILSLCSMAGIEYGYLRPGSLTAYEYRPTVRMIGYTLGIALLACSVPEELGPRFAVFIRHRQLARKHLLGLAGLAIAASTFVCVYALDGMPHIIDGTSYLLQARTLWSGGLTLDAPMHPELFAGELVHFHLTDAGYFSKYPAGWPLILGLFDTLGAPWLANAMMAGLLVLVTYAFAAERCGHRMAGMAAALVATCPWLWLNAGTMMPHVASAALLWTFLWMMLRAQRLKSRACAVGAGLAFGAAVLTRPADAAFFALPCVIACLCWMLRRPDLWLTRLPLVAVAALPGMIAYLWINRTLTGTVTGSTYGSGHGEMLFGQTPDSLLHATAWLHQSWVGVSTMWFAGALPVVVLILCGIVFGRPYLKNHWLAMACAASLLLCYTVFVFGGRAWVGPRWYVPLIPALALIIAAGLKAAAHAGRLRSPGGVLAAGYLRALLVAGVVVFGVVVPMKIAELKDRPPHGIDRSVVQAVEQAGLSQAVVALPASGLDPLTSAPNYKRGIAGMWVMQTPFDESDVIYISAIEGWQQMAAEAWPTRSLYVMNDQAGDMTLTIVKAPPTYSEAGR